MYSGPKNPTLWFIQSIAERVGLLVMIMMLVNVANNQVVDSHSLPKLQRRGIQRNLTFSAFTLYSTNISAKRGHISLFPRLIKAGLLEYMYETFLGIIHSSYKIYKHMYLGYASQVHIKCNILPLRVSVEFFCWGLS